jgi:hypothetical protein
MADVAKLTLTSTASISKPSDELQMKIGVITHGSTAREALAENSSQMELAIANLESIGLVKGDYETSHFSINPTYTTCPRNPPENWRAEINGYEVNNTILIHTPKMEMAGQIIDSANEAGANSITDIRFALSNPRDYWTEVLAEAGSNGVRDAEAIASSTGVRLVRILSISLNNTQVHSHQMNLASFAKVAGAAPPIEAGEVSLTANISLTYEIE